MGFLDTYYNKQFADKPVEPSELLKNDSELRSRYDDFCKRHSPPDDPEMDSDVLAHGASDGGEVILLRYDTPGGYHLAAFDLTTSQETEFTDVKKQDVIGEGDHVKIILAAQSPDKTIALLLLGSQGNEWKSGATPSSELRDMRYTSQYLAQEQE